MSKTVRILSVAACVAALALPAVLAGEGSKCTGTTQECLDSMAAHLRERGWVGVELDPAADGYRRVSRVVEDSPAERAGIRVGDVLLAIDGQDLARAERTTWQKLQGRMKPGNTITYTVDRSGSRTEVPVRLAEVPDAVLAQWVGNHMLEHATVALARDGSR